MFLYFFQPGPLLDALQIFLIGVALAAIIYLVTEWFLRITGLEKLIHRFLGHQTRIGSDPLPKALGKYLSIFVFLLFLRNAVQKAGYTEVEQFLDSIVNYLPHLLLALLITFFGIQLSRTSYTIVYKAANFENPQTAVILGNTARLLVLFFTITIAISQVNTGTIELIPDYLIRSVLIGFVAASSLAFGLAFGLGGREAAAEFIREYLHKQNAKNKDLKNEK
jgi:hypothetical protein